MIDSTRCSNKRPLNSNIIFPTYQAKQTGIFATLGGRGKTLKTYVDIPINDIISISSFFKQSQLSSQGSLIGAARPAVRAAFSIKASQSVSQIGERWLCWDKPDHEETCGQKRGLSFVLSLSPSICMSRLNMHTLGLALLFLIHFGKL